MPSQQAIRHFVFDTPFGKAAFVFHESPFKLLEILLPKSSLKKLAVTFKRGSWGKPGTVSQIQTLNQWMIGYFDGKTDPKLWPPWEWLDMTGLTILQQSVLRATAAIPYGKFVTYGQLAKTAGRPGSARFVGTTMARNPFPILIPCHRVIRSDGSIGQFGGGTELKKKLLEREARLAAA